jgi:hypothetical protein
MHLIINERFRRIRYFANFKIGITTSFDRDPYICSRNFKSKDRNDNHQVQYSDFPEKSEERYE